MSALEGVSTYSERIAGAKALRDFAGEIEDDTMVPMAESVVRSHIARLAREEADEIEEKARLLGPARGWELIAAERERQIGKGYTPEHDAEHQPRDLIDAAMGYLATAGEEDVNPYIYYPWMNFKRGTTQEHLVKAGALIAAALDLITEDDPKDPE